MTAAESLGTGAPIHDALIAGMDGVLTADHPAAISCLTGVRVNGRDHRMVRALPLAGGWISELIRVAPFTKAEKRGGGEYGSGLVERRRAVSSIAIDWKRGHGPGSSCQWCGGLFEL